MNFKVWIKKLFTEFIECSILVRRARARVVSWKALRRGTLRYYTGKSQGAGPGLHFLTSFQCTFFHNKEGSSNGNSLSVCWVRQVANIVIVHNNDLILDLFTELHQYTKPDDVCDSLTVVMQRSHFINIMLSWKQEKSLLWTETTTYFVASLWFMRSISNFQFGSVKVKNKHYSLRILLDFWRCHRPRIFSVVAFVLYIKTSC